MNISQVLLEAASLLSDSGVPDPRREASSLLLYILNREPIFLIAHPEYDLTDKEERSFREFLRRRAGREPFHYIVGHKEFFGLDFDVSPHVLIPRPETEILVEEAIKILRQLDKPSFCEIGVGSGCISVSILKNLENATAIGVDISEKALATAARNAAKLTVADRLTLHQADIFNGITGKFDLIVSNPPYIPNGDIPVLQPEVRDHEPHTALAGGSDGLDVIEQIVRESPEHLQPSGVLLIEIGFGQSDGVFRLFAPSIWRTPEFLSDLQGIPRIVKAHACH